MAEPVLKQVVRHETYFGKVEMAYEVRVAHKFVGYVFSRQVAIHHKGRNRRLITGTSRPLRWGVLTTLDGKPLRGDGLSIYSFPSLNAAYQTRQGALTNLLSKVSP